MFAAVLYDYIFPLLRLSLRVSIVKILRKKGLQNALFNARVLVISKYEKMYDFIP